MSDQRLLQRIQDLEEQLKARELEVVKYRRELINATQILENMTAELGKDLQIAAAVQKILSPTELPHIPGVELSSKFRAGMDRGGDYFDIFEHEDKLKFGLVVTCSSGYAMSALFLSVLIQLSSKIEARKGLPPDQVLLQMANEIVSKIHERDSADVFYGVMDRRNYELSYSLAGDIYGFHHDQDAGRWVRLMPSAPPISKNFQQLPLKETISMGPKDQLLVCTQGVVQAENAAGEHFGVDRLNRLFAAAPSTGVHELRNEILFQVEQFSGKTEPSRDQTILVLEIKDRVLKLAKK